MRVAIVIHAFYETQLRLISKKILTILAYPQTDVSFDIFVTFPRVGGEVNLKLINKLLPTASIREFDNYGMDLLPFFQLIPELQAYDWVLKLHTKNTKNRENQIWFNTLVTALIDSPTQILNEIQILKQNANWQMAGIMPFFVSSKRLMLANEVNITRLAQLWHLDTAKDWGFFAGSFYWLRPQKFLEPARLLLANQIWFQQDYTKDGQTVHALERVISLLALQYGDIGLLLPSIGNKAHFNISSSSHKYAINSTLISQLINNINGLENDIDVLNLGLLDYDNYKAQVSLAFIEKNDIAQHYLLIGRNTELAKLSYPFYLKKVQQEIIDWKKVQQASRNTDLVSIIIPVFNEISLTLNCLKSIQEHTQDINYEVIVVNNGSNLKTKILLNSFARFSTNVKVINLEKNLNFAIGCNIGFASSQGNYVVFLNNDTLVTPNWLHPLLECIERKNILAVQPKLLYLDGKIQSAGVAFGEDGFGYNRLEGMIDSLESNDSQPCGALTGACLCMAASDFANLQGFDPIYINGQEDIDLCMRIRKANLENMLWYCGDSHIYHITSQTVGRGKFIEQNRAIFFSKYLSSKNMEYMPMNKLKLANQCFEKRLFEKAIRLYEEALWILDDKNLRSNIIFNMKLARFKMRQGVQHDLSGLACEYKISKPDFISNDDYKAILESNIFDPNYYFYHYGDSIKDTNNLLEHYLKIGQYEGYRPSEYFDIESYKESNLDLLDVGLEDFFMHFVRHGKIEGRKSDSLYRKPLIQYELNETVVPKTDLLDIVRTQVQQNHKRILTSIHSLDFFRWSEQETNNISELLKNYGIYGFFVTCAISDLKQISHMEQFEKNHGLLPYSLNLIIDEPILDISKLASQLSHHLNSINYIKTANRVMLGLTFQESQIDINKTIRDLKQGLKSFDIDNLSILITLGYQGLNLEEKEVDAITYRLFTKKPNVSIIDKKSNNYNWIANKISSPIPVIPVVSTEPYSSIEDFNVIDYHFLLDKAIKYAKTTGVDFIIVNSWHDLIKNVHSVPSNFNMLDMTRMVMLQNVDWGRQEYFNNRTMAIVIHSFYPDVLEEFLNRIRYIANVPYKIYVTTPPERAKDNEEILQRFSVDYEIMVCENHGRDVKPFFEILSRVIENRHIFVLKLHTKKSPQRTDGSDWRNDLVSKLLDAESVLRVYNAFINDKQLGLVGPASHSIQLGNTWGNEYILAVMCTRLGLSYHDLKTLEFFGGTMFFVRTASLVPLLQILDKASFDAEAGQFDGTYAHVLERMFTIIQNLQNLKVLDTQLKKPSHFDGYKFYASKHWKDHSIE